MLYVPAVLLLWQVMPFHPHKEASALDLGHAAPSQQYQQALDSEQELLRVCATLKDMRSATYQTLDKVGAQESGCFQGCLLLARSAHAVHCTALPPCLHYVLHLRCFSSMHTSVQLTPQYQQLPASFAQLYLVARFLS